MIPDYLNAREWLVPIAVLTATCLLVLIWSYARSTGPVKWRLVCATCKALAIALLGLCLLEPMRVFEVPRTGANLMIVLADSSRSLQIRDRGESQSRDEQMRAALVDNKAWREQLGEAFDLRQFTFDDSVDATEFAVFNAEGVASAISDSLNEIGKRFRNRPSAGIILLTDGNDTGPADLNLAELPPVYPVIVGNENTAEDTGIARLSVSQTNFEAAPVTIVAEIETSGFQGKPLSVQLLKSDGSLIEEQSFTGAEANQAHSVRFQFNPEEPGVSDFRVRVLDRETAAEIGSKQLTASRNEATVANNQRSVIVDRARGPYRVLYVSGRPNWEFKFLRRAVQKDDEVDLVGLIRIAREEPKFTFRSRRDERTNPLFHGFGNDRDEEAQQYNEPVLVRMGTTDAEELRDGFPKSAEQLFEYQAIILDDVEAAFFSQEQLALIEQFVSQRGGGFLMLGGQESFTQGDYDRTPVGQLLPVYLDTQPTIAPDTGFRLELTREGWLQPWVRVESTEPEEHQRLETMPGFATLNQVRSIKPGASVLARVASMDGDTWPALVAQRYGRGRSAALLIGDFWRWHLGGDKGEDLLKSWRQTVRWLVADVPRRVDIRVESTNENGPGKTIFIDVVDKEYLPANEARVVATITRPNGEQVEIPVRPADDRAGTWQLDYLSRQSGVYRIKVVATQPDGTLIGERSSGWVADSDATEFARLKPNRDYLQRIADQTGGELIELDELDSLSRRLPAQKVPLMDRKVKPWWHSAWIFCIALSLLMTEWGLRRWQGMA